MSRRFSGLCRKSKVNIRFRLCGLDTYIRLVLALAGFIIWIPPQIAPAETVDSVVVKLNEDIITRSDLAEAAARHARQAGENSNSITSEVLCSLFDRTLLLQEARRQKIKLPEEELQQEVEKLVEEIKSQYPSEQAFLADLTNSGTSLEKLKRELMKKARDDFKLYQAVSARYSISDSDVKQFERNAEEEGKPVGEFKLLRLAVEKKKRGSAQAREHLSTLLTKFNVEGLSFADGIQKYSEVPGAKENGGELGYVSLDQLAPEVRDAVKNLEQGQASQPVATGDYLSVFYVEEKRGARSVLSKQKYETERMKLLQELRRKAHLTIYDKQLKDLVPAEYNARLEQGVAANQNEDNPAPTRADESPVSASPYSHENSAPSATPPPATPPPKSPPRRGIRFFGR